MKSTPEKPARTKAERDELVEQYLPLVRYVIARLPVTMPSMLDRDDFYSVGVMGLMHAAMTYDPARGASFKTFAYTAIRGAVLDEIRRHDPVPRGRRERLREMDRAAQTLHAELGRAPTLEEIAVRIGARVDDLDDDLLAVHTSRMLSLDDTSCGGGGSGDGAAGSLAGMLVNDAAEEPDSSAARAEDIDRLASAISDLPEVDRNVIVLYHYEHLYLKEIGEILGVTESRISQILARATARLRLKMAAGKEDD